MGQKKKTAEIVRLLFPFINLSRQCNTYRNLCQIRGLFGKFVEFGHKMFKYLYNPYIFFLNITGGH